MAERIQSTNQSAYRYDATVGTAMEKTTKWKKRVTFQRVPTYQKNTTLLDISANNYVDNTLLHTGIRNNIFMAQPLQIYRKEAGAGTEQITAVASRAAVTIESLEMPGSTITVGPTDRTTHLEAIVINQKTNHDSCLSDDHPGKCTSFTTHGVCLDPATNARRRCRTSGILKHNYNSTSHQYLTNRNKTFQQNDYHFLQSGHTSTIPGTSSASQNVYRTQGSASSIAIYDSSGVLSSCTRRAHPFTPVFFKPNNPTFSKQGAVDSSSYILRRKFDSITNNVAQYRKVYGNAVANAMGYGIADSVYTYKDKIGFPLKKTPVITPYKPTKNCCTRVSID